MSAPPVFQALYTSLDEDLTAFNQTIAEHWDGSKYPTLFAANLFNANADAGPNLVNAGSVTAIQVQLQQLKAMGVKAVTIEVSFPMLYEPFFASPAQFQQFVAFYQNLAVSVRAMGLKLIVENECLLNDPTVDGWNVGPFYAGLSWAEYQAARAQTAVTIAQTMLPDYMVVLEEPDTEAAMSGQTEVGTPAGAATLLSAILNAVQAAHIPGVLFGAGIGSWLSDYAQFIDNFLALPVDFIDMHVLVVNLAFLPNALAIAQMAAAAGKPIAITQAWLHKEADAELNAISNDVVLARNPFSFWAPLDVFFIQTLLNLANYAKLAYLDFFESNYFFAYLPYGPTTENLSPSAILAMEGQQANISMQAGLFTGTAVAYYDAITAGPDTVPPTAPGDLTAGSAQATQVYLKWTASTDNIGVAGYRIYRNGAGIATTANLYYIDSTTAAGTSYSYAVEAYSLAGNVSKPALVTVATPAG